MKCEMCELQSNLIKEYEELDEIRAKQVALLTLQIEELETMVKQLTKEEVN